MPDVVVQLAPPYQVAITMPGTQVLEGDILVGPQGPQGIQGVQGDRAGLKYYFDDSTGAGTPAAGHLKFNSSTLSAVTRISIRDTDADGTNTSALLNLLDDSTSTIKARVVIRSNSNADTSHFNFLVTSVTDEGNHHHINGTYVSGSTFTNDEVVAFDFYITGDKGEQGIQGEEGPQGPQGIPGTSSVTYATVTSALDAGGGLIVRYDATQPEEDCLWCAPSGQVVLITGS